MRWSILTIFLAAACSQQYRPTFAPIDSDGHDLRDAEGRVKLYRGVNVHIAGIFDVTFDDGRAPREPLPEFSATDPMEMRARGFNLVRLPINWSAIEPARDQFDDAYLDRVAGIVALCRAAGVDVLIDLHEDGWSKEICEDGAPLWAIQPPLTQLTGGPVPGPDCHTAAAALGAFDSFWADADGLQEAYMDMLAHVAERFRDDPAVIGYEIMNEPVGVDDVVQQFQGRAAARLRATDGKKLIVFEPSATRNFTNGAPVSSTPFPVAGAVYAVHIYTVIFGDQSALDDGTYKDKLHGSISGARDEADGWHTPLMVTEYGLGSTQAHGADWITATNDELDATAASSTWWLWKDPSPGGWGLFDPPATAGGNFTPRAWMMGALSRPYAQAIGGNLDAMTWDGTTLTIKFTGRGDVPPRHDVFFPDTVPSVACDGKPTLADNADSGVYTVRCGGGGQHTLTFTRN
jgi:endoglycosylceramidase